MELQRKSLAISALIIITFVVIDICAIHQPFAIKLNSISSENIITKIVNTAFSLCYMECYKKSNCKSIGMIKSFGVKTGECYLLDIIPVNSLQNVKNVEDTIVITRKENVTGTCGGSEDEDCDGTEKNPTKSCNYLRSINPSLKSGYYWLDLGKPTKVFCDMDTDGGGWIMIGSVVTLPDNPVDYTGYTISSSDITKLNEVKDNKFLLSTIAMEELRSYTNFSQFRMYCTKYKHQRVFHVMTTKDDAGFKVIDYFSLKSDERPSSCNSYSALSDDTSRISSNCDRWKDSKWSSGVPGPTRFFNHFIFIPGYVHINLVSSSGFECDDTNGWDGTNTYGVWQYFVR